jgi:hypothetical protein
VLQLLQIVCSPISWKFKTRYKEHIKDITNNKPKPGFSQHGLDMKQTYMDINKYMDNLHVNRKGKYINILKQFHIYKNAKFKIHLNNTYRNAYKPIFDITLNF